MVRMTAAQATMMTTTTMTTTMTIGDVGDEDACDVEDDDGDGVVRKATATTFMQARVLLLATTLTMAAIHMLTMETMATTTDVDDVDDEDSDVVDGEGRGGLISTTTSALITTASTMMVRAGIVRMRLLAFALIAPTTLVVVASRMRR